jgi:hypothetical protein
VAALDKLQCSGFDGRPSHSVTAIQERLSVYSTATPSDGRIVSTGLDFLVFRRRAFDPFDEADRAFSKVCGIVGDLPFANSLEPRHASIDRFDHVIEIG